MAAAQGAARDEEEASELTKLGGGEGDTPLLPQRWRRASVAGVAAAALASLLLVVLATSGALAPRRPSAEGVTARELLGSRELADIMAENIAKAGRPGVSHATVAAHLDRLLAAGDGLHSRRLSADEAAAMLRSMRILGDGRAAALAGDFVEAVRATLAAGGDRADLEHRLAARLEPKLRELRPLYLDLYPRELRRPGPAYDDERVLAPSGPVKAGAWRVLRDFDAWKVGRGHSTAPHQRIDGAVKAQYDVALSLLRSRFGEDPPAAEARRLADEQYAFQEKDGSDPRVYESAIDCIEGEMFKAPTNCMTCISIMVGNAMDGMTDMFGKEKTS